MRAVNGSAVEPLVTRNPKRQMAMREVMLKIIITQLVNLLNYFNGNADKFET